MQDTWDCLHQEDPEEKGIALSSNLTWRITDRGLVGYIVHGIAKRRT